MRVLVLATKYFGIGGIETYTRLLSEAVADGARVDILSLLDGELVDRTYSGRYLGDQGHRPTVWAKARLVEEAAQCGARYDVVICGHISLAPVGLLLRRLFGVPYIVVAHGTEVWKPLSTIRQRALHAASHIIAVSYFTADMVAAIQDVQREHVGIVHPSVDPGLYRYAEHHVPRASHDGPMTLLTVTRLSSQASHKGCEAAIHALARALPGCGQMRYTIVGDGDAKPSLEALVRRLGLSAIVTFTGHISTPALAARYRAADIFVMPSTLQRGPDGLKGEGFGIVLIEAAAFGLPVVAGRGGGTPEAVHDGLTGILVDDHNAQELSHILTRLAHDGVMRSQMGTEGRRRVEQHFTFSRFKEKVAAVLSAVVRT
jgi:phosphatidyl-myo-inositol dimannoside synthase